MTHVPSASAAGGARKWNVAIDEKRIDAIFAALNQCELPGGAVGIALHGRPVYRKGFGLASMDLPLVLTPSTRMRIGSTTKHFTAFAYMLLCEQGHARVDDPVEKHLPQIHRVAHGITMRQLMGNIGGMRDVIAVRGQFSGVRGRAVSSGELLALYETMDDVDAPPGTTFLYNNGGWLLLSEAIERITGRALEQALRELVFDPVGMPDTLLRRWDTNFVPNSATPHMHSPAGFERAFYGHDNTGAGAMVSTVNDMLRWLAHMSKPSVGSEATWRAMTTPQMLRNGSSTGYGLGLISRKYRGVDTLYHGGVWLGASCQMLKVPEAGLDVIVILNRYDVSSVALVEQILDTCIEGLDAPLQTPQFVPATGIFQSPTTGRVIELRAASERAWAQGGHQIASLDAMDLAVVPDADGMLWPSGSLSYLRLGFMPIGDPQRPSAVRLSEFGNLDTCTAVPAVTQADAGSILGRYRSESTDTEALITATADEARLTTIGRFGSASFRLHPMAPQVWRAKSDYLDGVLNFRQGNGGFQFSDLFLRALPFRRCG